MLERALGKAKALLWRTYSRASLPRARPLRTEAEGSFVERGQNRVPKKRHHVVYTLYSTKTPVYTLYIVLERLYVLDVVFLGPRFCPPSCIGLPSGRKTAPERRGDSRPTACYHRNLLPRSKAFEDWWKLTPRSLLENVIQNRRFHQADGRLRQTSAMSENRGS